jgi:hypothetical protein
MSVSANQLIVRQDGCKVSHPVEESTHLYQGTMAFVNADGYLDDDTNSGANVFAGIVITEVDNDAAVDGAKDCDVWADGVFVLVGSGFTQGTVNSDIYATDNFTVTTTSAGGTYVGRCVGYISSTKIRVKIEGTTFPTNDSAVDLADDEAAVFGTGDDAILQWVTGDASNHSFAIGLGDTNQALHITDKAAIATDWNVGADTHPTVYVHSNTTPATDYMTIGGHDGTTGNINVAGGTTLAFQIAGTTEMDMTAAGVNVKDGNRLFVGVSAVPGTQAGANWIGLEDSTTDPTGTLTNSLAIYTPDAGDSLDFLHADGTTDSLGT